MSDKAGETGHDPVARDAVLGREPARVEAAYPAGVPVAPEGEHLKPERVAAFVRGELSGHEAAAAEEHLLACGQCAGLLGGLTGDPFVAALRRATGSADSTTTSANNISVSAAAGGSIADTDRSPPATAGRYRLRGEIARGGMGVVYRAHEPSIGREVAVKVLHDRYRTDRGAIRRFVAEAQLTGRLQHPGVPPVFEVGDLPDGSPFLAMKLIEGHTLAALLEATSRPDPAALLAVFEHICQAVAYAHSKGVIHRDLKPANVMVGAFGEVQVMDWGLAKDVRATEADVHGPVAPDAPGAADMTHPGAVMGTPAYMAPEQARGEPTDARADVFALGAVLCETLTGRRGFEGLSSVEVIKRVAAGELSESLTHLAACGADAELVTLAKSCLCADRDARPADAGAVAKAVAELRAAAEERARRAELDRVKAEGERARTETKAREQRKRQKVQLALAAAVGLFLVGGGAAAWWQDRQATARRTADILRNAEDERRAGRNREAVAVLLAECEAALRAGDAAKAELALAAAEKRAAEDGGEESADRLARFRSDLTVLRDLDGIDQFRWTPVESHLPAAAVVAARYREALARFGADPNAVPLDEACLRISNSTVRERLVGALDRLLTAERSERVRAALRAIDPDPYRDAVRLAVQTDDRVARVELANRLAALDQPPEFAAVIGADPLLAIKRRRELLAAAAQRRPQDLGVVMALCSTYQLTQGESDDQYLRWAQVAVSIAPGNASVRNNLGVALWRRGHVLASEFEFREVVRLDPRYAYGHCNLGLALRGKGDLDGAIRHYREAIRLDPKFAQVRTNLGIALGEKGDLDGAVREHREAVKLTTKGPLAHSALGNALRAKGDFDGAVREHREAVKLDPKSGLAHTSLGNVLREVGDLDGAVRAYQEAVKVDPRYAPAHNYLGQALRMKRDLDGAARACREAIKLDPNGASPHSNLGLVLYERGDLDGAIASCHEALARDEKMASARSILARAERLVELRSRLPDVAAGRVEPATPTERCDFASLCARPLHHRYTLATRLYTRAFADDPALASTHGYDAACAAVMATTGVDAGSGTPSASECGALLETAHRWLRADLDTLRSQTKTQSNWATLRIKLVGWKADPALAPVRDRLAAMPPADRRVWGAFWSDVDAVLGSTAPNLVPPHAFYPRAALPTRFPVFHPDGRRLLFPDGKDVAIWDLQTGRKVRTLTGPTDRVMALRLTTDGKTVVALSNDHRVFGWNVETGEKQAEFPVPKTKGAVTLAVFPDGKRIAVPGPAGSVSLRDWPTGAELERIDLKEPDAFVFTLATSPDGRRLAVAGAHGKVWVWDVDARKVETTLPAVPNQHTHAVCAFSPDGRHLAVGASTTLRVWAVGHWAEQSLSVPTDASGMVAFGADGRTVATCSVQSSGERVEVTHWDVKTGAPRGRLTHPLTQPWVHCGLAADGRTLAIDVESRWGFLVMDFPAQLDVAPVPHSKATPERP